MKISIITVCYNAEKQIRKTIESVLEQSYKDIEYVIVDGTSNDNTLRIINEYKFSIGDRDSGKRMKVLSEPDQGIYDAMNKGITMATGDYIEFLNAGDFFVDTDVVKHVTEAIERNSQTGSKVFYGNIRYCYSDGTKELRSYGSLCGKKFYFMSGDCLNHQALFASRECFSLTKFNIEYQICADREWMMRLMNKKVPFICTDLLMCEYSLDEESASVKNREVYRAEAKKCMRQWEPLGYPVYLFFEFLRNNDILKKLLHWIYRAIYIRNQRS